MSRIDRKEQIITCAIELFQSRGFADVSTRDLADYAGLSRSHVYHYFSDWKQLRREAFARFADQQLEEVRTPLTGMKPTQALQSFLRDCLPTDAGSGWTLWLDAWDESLHDPEFAKVYLGVNAQWQGMLAKLIIEGVEMGEFHCHSPERAARQIFSVTMGYADDLLLRPSEDAAEAILAEVMEIANLVLNIGVQH